MDEVVEEFEFDDVIRPSNSTDKIVNKTTTTLSPSSKHKILESNGTNCPNDNDMDAIIYEDDDDDEDQAAGMLSNDMENSSRNIFTSSSLSSTAKSAKQLTMDKDLFIRIEELEMLRNGSEYLSLTKKVKKLRKEQLSIFKPQVEKMEKMEIVLQHQNSRLYETKLRTDTPLFNINARCSYSHECPVTYKISALRKQVQKHVIKCKLQRYGIHDHNRPERCKGQKRKSIGERIFSQHGGSAQAARMCDLAENDGVAPSPTIYRRIKYETNKRTMATFDWMRSIIQVADTFKQAEKECVQKLEFVPEFQAYLHILDEIECLQMVPARDRIGCIHMCSNLVSVPKKLRKYANDVHNYFVLARDIANNSKSISYAEMLTTARTRISLTHFLITLIDMYERKCLERLTFRVLICDYDWASIYAIVHAFELEGMSSYSKKIYEMSNASPDELDNFTSNTTLVGSCAVKTLQRFICQLNSAVGSGPSTRKIRELASLSFSLLLNSLELKIMDAIFSNLIITFLSKYQTTQFQLAFANLNDSINAMSTADRSNTKRLFDEIESFDMKKTDAIVTSAEVETTTDDNHETRIEQDMYEFDSSDMNPKKFAIRNGSPFTTHFSELKAKLGLGSDMDNEEELAKLDKNAYYSEEFVDMLMYCYMPYCFIWTGFVFRGIEPQVSRLENVSIESFIDSQKRSAKSKNLPEPAKYIQECYTKKLESCADFKQTYTKSLTFINNFPVT